MWHVFVVVVMLVIAKKYLLHLERERNNDNNKMHLGNYCQSQKLPKMAFWKLPPRLVKVSGNGKKNIRVFMDCHFSSPGTCFTMQVVSM